MALRQFRNYLELGRKEETWRPELVSGNREEEEIVGIPSPGGGPDKEKLQETQVSDREGDKKEDPSKEIHEEEEKNLGAPPGKPDHRGLSLLIKSQTWRDRTHPAILRRQDRGVRWVQGWSSQGGVRCT